MYLIHHIDSGTSDKMLNVNSDTQINATAPLTFVTDNCVWVSRLQNSLTISHVLNHEPLDLTLLANKA